MREVPGRGDDAVGARAAIERQHHALGRERTMRVRVVLRHRQDGTMRMPDRGIGNGAEPAGSEATRTVRGHHDKIRVHLLGDLGDEAGGRSVLHPRIHAYAPLGTEAACEVAGIGLGTLTKGVVRGEHVLGEHALGGRADDGERHVHSEQGDGTSGAAGDIEGDGQGALGERRPIDRDQDGAEHGGLRVQRFTTVRRADS